MGGAYDAEAPVSMMLCNLIWGMGGWVVLFGFVLPVYLGYMHCFFVYFHGLHDIFV